MSVFQVTGVKILGRVGTHIILARLHEVQKSYYSHHSRTCSSSLSFCSRHPAFKFSRSPYLDNHSSESIHTCTIDT